MGSFGQKPALDPRQQPTPDFGTVGPGSDINPAAVVNPSADPTAHLSTPTVQPVFMPTPRPATASAKPAPAIPVVGIGIGIALVLLGTRGPLLDLVARIQKNFESQGNAVTRAVVPKRDLENQQVQREAELLLERAVSDYEGTNDQLAARFEHWHGRLKMTPNLNTLVTNALNSNDMRVRATALEVYLAAYDIPETPVEVQEMQKRADSSDHATKIWALWTLGALAGRGVEPETITQTLIAHLKEPDPVSRQWAVEGLALTGTDASIAPLLSTFHDDSSPMVRERAACSLAQSGMLKPEQRMSAVPQILAASSDPTLDAQTQGWAFQALRDITSQNLPNDSTAWRDWWQKNHGQS